MCPGPSPGRSSVQRLVAWMTFAAISSGLLIYAAARIPARSGIEQQIAVHEFLRTTKLHYAHSRGVPASPHETTGWPQLEPRPRLLPANRPPRAAACRRRADRSTSVARCPDQSREEGKCSNRCMVGDECPRVTRGTKSRIKVALVQPSGRAGHAVRLSGGNLLSAALQPRRGNKEERTREWRRTPWQQDCGAAVHKVHFGCAPGAIVGMVNQAISHSAGRKRRRADISAEQRR